MMCLSVRSFSLRRENTMDYYVYVESVGTVFGPYSNSDANEMVTEMAIDNERAFSLPADNEMVQACLKVQAAEDRRYLPEQHYGD